MSLTEPDHHIALNDASFECLLQKFREEIAELRSAVSDEASPMELKAQLQEAVAQSEELHQELLQVFDMYRAAQNDQRRPFTEDEMAALRYFGFSVPPDGRPPAPGQQGSVPPVTNDHQPNSSIQLPSRRVLSTVAPEDEIEETETDAYDTLHTSTMRGYEMREKTPDVTSPMGGYPIHVPELTPIPSQSRRVAKISHATPSRPAREEDTPATRERNDNLLMNYEMRIVELQREVLDARAALLSSKENFLEERAALDRLHRQELQAAIAAERERGTELARTHEASAASLRSLLESERARRDELESVANASHQRRAAALAEVVALREGLLPMISKLHDDISAAQQSRAKNEAIDAWSFATTAARSEPSRHSASLVMQELADLSRDEVRTADDAAQAVREWCRIKSSHDADGVAYSCTSCIDADEIDVAVTRTLNELRLPFVVSIRRLGRGGDYFIDCRVQMKLAGTVVMTRPRQPPTHSSAASQYEPLSVYLMHLYAPLLPLPLGTANGAVMVSSAPHEPHELPHDESDALMKLTAHRAALEQSLQLERQRLQHIKRQLQDQLSPSPQSAEKQREPVGVHRAGLGWLRPPSPSPSMDPTMANHNAVSRLSAAAPPKGKSDAAPQYSDEGLQKSRSASSASATSKKAPIHTGGQSSRKGSLLPHGLDLSQLSTEELEQLKRAALAQQVREMKHLGSTTRR